MLTLMLDERHGELFIITFTMLLIDMPAATLFSIMEAEHLT